ncbi:MAG: M20/M25/M40 family metallo-hydrolase [Anaerolineales bacterium]|nr:M20/M25/M40 family metallo-hydrolase [Anaerolineales bacterium]
MTVELTPLLKKMITAPGLSGYEAPIREIVAQAWQPLVDELSTSRLGSLHGLRRGSGTEPRPSVLVSTHMDAIGMMVTQVVDGFIRFTEIGGLDPRVLPGQAVTVHGREDLPGVITQPRAPLLPPDVRNNAVPMEHLFIDTGLLPKEVARLVRVGDVISYAQPPIDLAGETLAGHSMDNRASVAALTLALDILQTRPHTWDVWAVASAQEEETLGGATTSAFQLQPAFAIVIDVTHGSSPGAPSHKTYPMGKGPAIGWGPNIHPVLFKAAKTIADRMEIPYSVEVMPRHSGTDAYAIQVVAEGIPSLVISIPLRYMHTPVEVVSLKDIQRTARLTAELIASLDASFMDQMKWDE